MVFSQRSCGILAHISSIPGKEGMGEIGNSAFAFLDFLAESKQSCWAILPLGPVNLNYNNNPYISLSSFAGREDFLCIELLYQEGLITKLEYDEFLNASSIAESRQDVQTLKKKILLAAGARFRHYGPQVKRTEFERFCKINQSWLEDYASFRAIKDYYGGQPWYLWPDDIAAKDNDVLRSARIALDELIISYKYMQFEFARQWERMRSLAKAKGIKIFGDLPFFCGLDSAEVWANQDLFFLRYSSHSTSLVAALPPSPGCAEGQVWNKCPMYDWDEIESRNFDWMIQRLQLLFERVDLVRLDHFQGYIGTWCVPLDAVSASGCLWLPGPGDRLFQKIMATLPHSKFVAEDLGFFPESVIKLRDRWNIAGMKVLQYAFDTDHNNPHLPHNYFTANCVVYTGTHDTDTSVGWYKNIPENQKKACNYYLQLDSDENVNWSLIQYGAYSIANQLIIPLQDVLGLGSDCRINIPGTEHAAWDWVCQAGVINLQLASKLADLVIKTERIKNQQNNSSDPLKGSVL